MGTRQQQIPDILGSRTLEMSIVYCKASSLRYLVMIRYGMHSTENVLTLYCIHLNFKTALRKVIK